MEFLFIETPSQKIVAARSEDFLAPVTPVWHFCPHGTPTQSARKQASAKCHCLAFPLRVRIHFCFSGKTDVWGAVVWETVGGKSFQEDRDRPVGSAG